MFAALTLPTATLAQPDAALALPVAATQPAAANAVAVAVASGSFLSAPRSPLCGPARRAAERVRVAARGRVSRRAPS